MDFPLVKTSFWDAIIAVPVVVIITQIIKVFPIPRQYIPTVAWLVGLAISVFFSHRHDLWAALFMGGFYGAAAVGTYSSMKVSWLVFRRPNKESYH